MHLCNAPYITLSNVWVFLESNTVQQKCKLLKPQIIIEDSQ